MVSELEDVAGRLRGAGRAAGRNSKHNHLHIWNDRPAQGREAADADVRQSAAFAAMLALSYGFTELLDRPSEIVTAIVGPIYHAAPNAHANFSFKSGANIVVTPRFDPESCLRSSKSTGSPI